MSKLINGVKYNTHEDLLRLSGLTKSEREEISLNVQRELEKIECMIPTEHKTNLE